MNRRTMCKLEPVVRRNEKFQIPSNGLSLENPTVFQDMEIKPSSSGLVKKDIQSTIKGVNLVAMNGIHRQCDSGNQAQNSFSYMSNTAFSEKYEEKIVKSLKPECIAVVDTLLEKIKQLSILQKILLYLKLPSSKEDPDVLDPLRRPLNPLGNRLEVSQALSYIKTHFSPDPDISLPKKEIYSDYISFCQKRKMKPLSTADFGKAMKQVYPVVRPRRLGERGNSRYCYSGLSNATNLPKPTTAASAQMNLSEKICRWASKVLNVNISNLTELSKLIPNENCSSYADYHKEKPILHSLTAACGDNKRKTEVENIDITDIKPMKQRKRSSPLKGDRKKSKVSNAQTQSSCPESKITLSLVCDNNQKPSEIHSFKLEPSILHFSDLSPEKSTNLDVETRPSSNQSSESKRQKISKKDDIKKSSALQYKTVSLLECQTVPASDSFDLRSIEDEGPGVENMSKVEAIKEVPLKHFSLSKNLPMSPSKCDNIVLKSDIGVDSNEAQDCDRASSYADVGYLPSDCLGHYLQDEGNSQEPEEELLKYFKDPLKTEPKDYTPENNMSQLRLLLEQNLSSDAAPDHMINPSERDTGFSEEDSLKSKPVNVKSFFILSPQQDLQETVQKTALIVNNSSKRRVSFENIPVSFSQSPNNPRKSFSFTPISPRPPTVSKSTIGGSPFVFPRETVFRGKQSSLNSNAHQMPVPSPATVQISPLKVSRSSSQSSTPSPITNSRSQLSNVFKGRCTPQDSSQDHTDSLKSSPLISPSSSSGVFLSPASPMSSCNSPVFTFRKSMSPIKQTDEFKPSKSNTSLLQSLLMTDKTSGNKFIQVNNASSLIPNDVESIQKEPLTINVIQLSPKEKKLASKCHPLRSQSVPADKNNLVISPSSKTLAFPVSSFRGKEDLAFLDLKPNDLDMWDSVLNRYNNSSNEEGLIENSSDHDTMDSESQAVNEVSMESVISNLCDFLNDKGLSSTSTNGSVQLSQVSRSHPNTPLLYNECSNSSRDPVVSAFPVVSASKSYPSTPTTANHSYASSSTSSTAKRNINPLLDSIPGPSFDDMELQLNNLHELSGCDDAFNELAREVENNSDFTSE